MKTKYFLAIASFAFSIQYSNAQMVGNGTPGSPYQVTTCAELQQVQSNLSAYYVLMNDIDCSQTQTGGGPWTATGFVPIGNDTTAPFTGNFNGRCFAIKNLYINNPTHTYVVIFVFMDAPGKIAIVNVIDATVIGGNYTGILLGYKHSSTMDTCYTTGSVTGNDLTGGVVGRCSNYQGPNCQITNTFSKAVVSGHDYVGGVVGQITTYQGGLAMMQNCFATGDVSGNNYVGGLSGNTATYQGGAPELINCYATGNVSGVMDVGGLSGWVGPFEGGGSTVQRSYATGNVTGTTNVGGLIGSNGPTSGGASVILTSYAQGNVSGTTNVGGLVGMQNSIGIGWGIDTSYATGKVTGTTDVGGLVGNQTGSSAFDTCFWNITINPSLQSIGNVGGYSSIYPSTTAQMQTQATYLGWDFTNTWAITANNYPTFIPLNTSGNCHFPSTLEAAFNYSPYPSCINDSIHFTDASVGSPTSWNWNFSDVASGHNTSTLQNPAHLFSGYGIFNVTLISTVGATTDTITTPVLVTSCITGAEQINKSACNVSVYPNPGNGIFTFNIQNASANSQLEVYNVLGEKVYSKFTTANSPFTIDISNQAKGVYFYKLISNSVVEKNGKLVAE